MKLYLALGPNSLVTMGTAINSSIDVSSFRSPSRIQGDWGSSRQSLTYRPAIINGEIRATSIVSSRVEAWQLPAKIGDSWLKLKQQDNGLALEKF